MTAVDNNVGGSKEKVSVNSPERKIAPYGSWPSTLPAVAVAQGEVRRSEPRVSGSFVVWSERRPTDGGRCTISFVDLDEGGSTGRGLASRNLASRDLASTVYADVATRVHEYGGGAWIPLPAGTRASGAGSVSAGSVGTSPMVLGSNTDDQQRVWLFDDSAGTPVTPEPAAHGAKEFRYADPALVGNGPTSVWVRETHPSGSGLHGEELLETEPLNEIVMVQLDGTVTVLAQGADFYSSPRPSPDGTKLAFISWDHPNMPWDHTRLHVIDLTAKEPTGTPNKLDGLVLQGAALQQPLWSPDGRLHVISDASGYWDILQVDLTASGTGDAASDQSRTTPLIQRESWALEVEMGVPGWVFGEQTYAWIPGSNDRLWCTWIDQGVGHIGIIEGRQLTEVKAGFTEFGRLEVTATGDAVTLASNWNTPAAVVKIAPDGSHHRLSPEAPVPLDSEAISVPQPIEFACLSNSASETAHAFFYPPTSNTHQAPEGELPPLIVIGHGGPTSRARSSFDLGIQYWTNRGIGVVDVNYRGSTGFGTDYRNKLQERWGIVDVDDCVAAALYLSGQPPSESTAETPPAVVDPQRLSIKGGSAGGYTTLCALVNTDTFAAGISRYGVADLATLASDTHKFESRYLDSLIGPWPAAADVYRERSPIYKTEQLRTPMLVLQGDQDFVVPPSQSEQLVSALADAGVPHCYLLFEGEPHGFRQEQNIIAAMEAELSFLGQILGFNIADPIEPIAVQRPGRV